MGRFIVFFNASALPQLTGFPRSWSLWDSRIDVPLFCRPGVLTNQPSTIRSRVFFTSHILNLIFLSIFFGGVGIWLVRGWNVGSTLSFFFFLINRWCECQLVCVSSFFMFVVLLGWFLPRYCFSSFSWRLICVVSQFPLSCSLAYVEYVGDSLRMQTKRLLDT